MPVSRLWKYVKQLPQLEAERGLDLIAQVAAGTGSMEERAHKQYMRDMRRAAAGGQEHVQKATMASLAAIGIAVETLPAPGEESAAKPKPRARKPRKPKALQDA